MNDSEQAAAVDANYWESFTLLAKACGGEILERDDFLAVSTGLPVPMLNIGFVKQPLSDPETALGEIVKFYDDRGMPFVVRVREGVDSKSEEAAKAMGMPYSDTVPGMALFPIADPPPAVDGLTIQAVKDEQALVRYRQVIAVGFGMPLAFAERMLSSEFLGVPGFDSFLGVMDGEPVATSSVYANEGTAGVYNVATLSSHRRQGIGEALTAHAISHGREAGCTVATLQASEMGRPVYERMGFRTVAPYRTFRLPDQGGSR